VFTGRVVVFVAFITKLGLSAEDAESMCKAFGYPNPIFVFGAQSKTLPFSECGGGAAEVNRDIKDLSFDNPNKLSLWSGVLEVQATENALLG
jgi:hypothetical protein